MKEFTGDVVQENCVEWIKGAKTVTVTFPKGKYATKIQKLSEQYPEEVKICHENNDGSIVAHIPIGYVSIRHPRTYSEEQKKKMRDRLRIVRNDSNTGKNSSDF